MVQWVEKIRQTPDLDINLEDRLMSVFSQLIEQKFRTLNYEELSKMLRLTPLYQTDSFQKALKKEKVEDLLSQIEVKFGISPEMSEAMGADLAKLDMNILKALIRQLLRLDTFEQLELWISDHLPERSARVALEANPIST